MMRFLYKKIHYISIDRNLDLCCVLLKTHLSEQTPFWATQ